MGKIMTHSLFSLLLTVIGLGFPFAIITLAIIHNKLAPLKRAQMTVEQQKQYRKFAKATQKQHDAKWQSTTNSVIGPPHNSVEPV